MCMISAPDSVSWIWATSTSLGPDPGLLEGRASRPRPSGPSARSGASHGLNTSKEP